MTNANALPIQDRLRATHMCMDTEGEIYHIPANPDGAEAADHIDALEKALRGLVALTSDLDDAGPYGQEYQSDELEEAIATARAALGEGE